MSAGNTSSTGAVKDPSAPDRDILDVNSKKLDHTYADKEEAEKKLVEDIKTTKTFVPLDDPKDRQRLKLDKDEDKQKELMENLHLFTDLARSSPELAGMFDLDVPACVSAASGNSSTLVSAWHQHLKEQEGNTLEDWGKECEHQVLSQVAALEIE